MAPLKNNLENVSKDTETLVRDYLKFFSLRQSEKFALLLATVTSVFIVAILVIILTVFLSFVLAGSLNKLLESEFWGFVIIGGLYLIILLLLFVKVFRSNTPPFTNLFVRLIVSIFDIDSNQSKSLSELKNSGELIREKIETDKKRIEADFQILRYSLVGSLLKEILSLFVSRKKHKEDPPASKTS